MNLVSVLMSYYVLFSNDFLIPVHGWNLWMGNKNIEMDGYPMNDEEHVPLNG